MSREAQRGSIQHIITGVGRVEGREGCKCMSSLQLQVTHSEFSHHPTQYGSAYVYKSHYTIRSGGIVQG